MGKLELDILSQVVYRNLSKTVRKHVADVSLSFEGSPEYLTVYLYLIDRFFSDEVFPENKWNEAGYYMEINRSLPPEAITLESILSDAGEKLDMETALKYCTRYARETNNYIMHILEKKNGNK